MMAKTKECVGVPKLDAKRHTTALDNFPVKVANPDGHSRRCKACQKLDRDARKAGKATTPTPEPQDSPGPELTVVDGTVPQVQEMAALEAAVEDAGGVGSEAGQAMLEGAADKASESQAKAQAGTAAQARRKAKKAAKG